MFNVMHSRGFPSRWMLWIEELLTSASSRVSINGDPSEFFIHKCELRQRDPLSPLLFNLAADVLQQMITSINNSLAYGITAKIKDSILAFQYVDDTTIISSANITSLTSLKLVIRLFAAISGLQVNYNKSIFIPINVHSNNLPWVKAVIGYPRDEFPVQYLGMSLSIFRPPRHCFMPVIEKIENKLGGWKTKLLSRHCFILNSDILHDVLPSSAMGNLTY